MRIVAGAAKGRRLAGPKGAEIRPTADRVKEALFASLQTVVPGARVLDLFAGTGALGLEALSRGATSVTFVERSRPALDVLRRNIDTVACPGPRSWRRTCSRRCGGTCPAVRSVWSWPIRPTTTPTLRSQPCWRPWWTTSPREPRGHRADLAGRAPPWPPTLLVPARLAATVTRRCTERSGASTTRIRRERCGGLSRQLRPHHDGPPRHHRAVGRQLRRGRGRGRRQPQQAGDVHDRGAAG
jgi:hypothetical protein